MPCALHSYPGGGAALIGGAIGIPLLLKQAKVWDSTISDYESAGKAVPNVLPTLRGKPEKVGKQALPEWMMSKEVEKDDQSVAGWIQRIKNAAFGGLQADIFEVGVTVVSLGSCSSHITV
jgi:hypothetical protein